MKIFQKTQEDEKRFNQFTAQVEQVALRLEKFSYGDKNIIVNINKLSALSKRFVKKTNNFFIKDRRLNIAVLGQVKAGKSTFLNTLLFNGEQILPKAPTPKTAALTKIEYAEENKLEIEFYDENDWYNIEENAVVDAEGQEYECAKELVNMARRNKIDVKKLIEEKKKIIAFDTYEDLENSLNDYVGENGKYTPLVRAVILYAHRPEFKEISIVDTPGLNDPVASRTVRTQEFIEECDVVFYLSPCSQFLDCSDVGLLFSQLPLKGVKRIYLIGSKLDSALLDVLRVPDPEYGLDDNKADNISDACKLVHSACVEQVERNVSEFENIYSDIIADCRTPILVSALTHNMSMHSKDKYDVEERHMFEKLSEFSENIMLDLRDIGNIPAVEKALKEVAAERDEILSGKYNNIVTDATEELSQMLKGFKTTAEKRLKLYNSEANRETLESKRKDLSKTIKDIKNEIETLRKKWTDRIKDEKWRAVSELKKAADENSEIKEHKGREKKTDSYVEDFSLIHLFTFRWTKKSRTVPYTYYETYTYINASDAVKKLMDFIHVSERRIEDTFNKAMSQSMMKKELLNIVKSNFAAFDGKLDVELFKHITEEKTKNIAQPRINMSANIIPSSIINDFNGQLKRTDEIEKMKSAYKKAVKKVYSDMVDKLENAASKADKDLKNNLCELQDTLLNSINEELDKTLSDLDDKEKSRKRYDLYIKEIDRILLGGLS